MKARAATTAAALGPLVLAACAGEIASPEFCEDCVVHEPVAILSFAGAPSFPDGGGRLAATGGGDRQAFVSASAPWEVLVFDGSGELEATVGTRGQGPGEFENIRLLGFDPEGRLWVVSRDGAQLDIFAPDLALQSSERLAEPVVHMAPITGGMVASVATSDGGRVGILSPTGDLQELWTVPSEAEGFPGGLSAFESDGDQRVWVAEAYRYRVWEIDLSGNARPLIEGAPDWFDARFRADVAEQMGDGRGTITALDHDPDADRLWMVTGVPSDTLTADDLATMYQTPDLDPDVMMAAMIDHVIEAFDASDGTRLAGSRRDLPRSITSPSPFRLSGPETVEVLRPVIERSTEGGGG